MFARKIAALALAASAFAATPALALSEGTVQQVDIARVGVQVAQIPDDAARLQAQNLLAQANAALADGNRSSAYHLLEGAADLVGASGNVAERN